ncbi:MAG: helix-hairpin-helix domain-containing protein [Pseudomonadales bacterium]|jgi:competence protein ComEA|nr:helix-hairpin-helix domain-containing protein [Pseudomonadales bacterium]
MLKKFLAALIMVFCTVAAFAAVDVNTASEADLDSIKGIGPALSARIMQEREKSKFKDWSDLISRVKGVGRKNAAHFSADGLTVSGTAYAEAEPAATATPAPAQNPPAKTKKDKAAAATAPASATSK